MTPSQESVEKAEAMADLCLQAAKAVSEMPLGTPEGREEALKVTAAFALKVVAKVAEPTGSGMRPPAFHHGLLPGNKAQDSDGVVLAHRRAGR